MVIQPPLWQWSKSVPLTCLKWLIAMMLPFRSCFCTVFISRKVCHHRCAGVIVFLTTSPFPSLRGFCDCKSWNIYLVPHHCHFQSSKEPGGYLHLEQRQAEVLLFSGYNFEAWSKDPTKRPRMLLALLSFRQFKKKQMSILPQWKNVNNVTSQIILF